MSCDEITVDSIRKELEELRKSAPDISLGDISDGYHTFNDLYHTRATLFSILCNLYSRFAFKTKVHYDGTSFEGMFLVSSIYRYTCWLFPPLNPV